METSPEPTAPSTDELAELEAEFARLEGELAALDDADANGRIPGSGVTGPTGSVDLTEGGEG